jgi:hypothetical protein
VWRSTSAICSNLTRLVALRCSCSAESAQCPWKTGNLRYMHHPMSACRRKRDLKTGCPLKNQSTDTCGLTNTDLALKPVAFLTASAALAREWRFHGSQRTSDHPDGCHRSTDRKPTMVLGARHSSRWELAIPQMLGQRAADTWAIRYIKVGHSELVAQNEGIGITWVD